ncbi:GGDEF domain-containing response regulator [Desulfovibrio inopinatus]|uniref:GGDEF domain-containing response regulator n=1 Tax=Desulfovibrio inopinatus TaxID=102109 RepID=UPI0004267F26|nr:diguanylate cyclase [Desulfovibrio inopinatus]
MLNTLHVLIVDDSRLARLEIRKMLEKHVGQIYEAANGQAGLDILNAGAIDIVITDIRMPEMDGLELARRIRAQANDTIALIFHTAFSDEESFLAALELGAESFIKKPVLPSELLQAVKAADRRLETLRHSTPIEQLQQSLLDHAPDFYIVTEGKSIIYLNRSCSSFLRCSDCEGEGLDSVLGNRFLLKRDDPSPHCVLFNNWSRFIQDFSDNEFIVTVRDNDLVNAGRSFLMRITSILVGGERYYVISFTDVSRLEQEREFYYDQSTKDPLTGIANRKILESELEREIVRSNRYGSPLSLAIFDIDDFKTVNDTYGHQVGDFVLVRMASIVSRMIRKIDVFCRYGGEEFILIMPETPLSGAKVAADKLRQTVADSDLEIPIKVTCSVGVATHQPGESGTALIARADAQLYVAKENGKNRVEIDLAQSTLTDDKQC